MRFGRTRFLDTKEMQSENWFWRMLNFNTHRGDQIGFGGYRNRDGLRNDFSIRQGVVIPAGEYTFSGFNMEARLSNQLEFSPIMSLNIGDYYNGKRMQVNAGFDWQPNEHINFGFNYNYQDIELPAGEFTVRLASANANYAFNSKWSWINLIQYDNFSNVVGINSRLRWNPEAGEDLYLVVNYNFEAEGVFADLNSRDSEIVLKYTKNFRF